MEAMKDYISARTYRVRRERQIAKHTEVYVKGCQRAICICLLITVCCVVSVEAGSDRETLEGDARRREVAYKLLPDSIQLQINRDKFRRFENAVYQWDSYYRKWRLSKDVLKDAHDRMKVKK